MENMPIVARLCYTDAMDRAIHRTTVDIEIEAYEQARRELGTRGYRDTINRALREIGRQAALRRGANLIREGKLDLVTPEELAHMRRVPD
jgi:Arc/MetJ family transcription regulator